MKVIQDVVSDLGLPSPEAIVVEDQDMADAYRSFCRLLHYASKPIAVLADGEFFALGDGQDEIPLTSYADHRIAPKQQGAGDGPQTPQGTGAKRGRSETDP